MITRSAVTLMGVGVLLLGGCGTNKVSTADAEPMAVPAWCSNPDPAAKEVAVAVKFDATGQPTGVSVNPVLVKPGGKICWRAVDSAGQEISRKFAIIYGPADQPNANQNWQFINVWPQVPIGVEYKYTIWSDTNKFLDPRIVID